MPTIAPNASAQHQALELIQDAKSKISEYETLLIHTSDKDLRLQISKKLKDVCETIAKEKKHFNLLQNRAAAQGRFQEKRKKQLEDGITFAQPSIESTTDMLSAHLIYPSSSTVTYLSAEEVNATLDSFDTQQIELSNAAILEDFTNLPSLGLSHKFETSNLLEALSDIE
ncbi:17821_t:CDS:2 [Dentiscutata erythropus]|uniref:17821_t:CDS:1 n=1 Tax=Dentiscutata erythropus TaxID=1348616 RepID=A0A9N9A167_9GLOM|nr:17821_t:CDS:2 [Dentiscutata erythropus]